MIENLAQLDCFKSQVKTWHSWTTLRLGYKIGKGLPDLQIKA